MNPANVSFADYLEVMPPWMRICVLITLWAIICVGVCLPLITLRLYWNNIAQLFGKESAYSDLDERHPFRTNKRHGNATSLSNLEPAQQKETAADAKNLNVEEQEQGKGVDVMKEFQDRKYWPKAESP